MWRWHLYSSSFARFFDNAARLLVGVIHLADNLPNKPINVVRWKQFRSENLPDSYFRTNAVTSRGNLCRSNVEIVYIMDQVAQDYSIVIGPIWKKKNRNKSPGTYFCGLCPVSLWYCVPQVSAFSLLSALLIWQWSIDFSFGPKGFQS